MERVGSCVWFITPVKVLFKPALSLTAFPSPIELFRTLILQYKLVTVTKKTKRPKSCYAHEVVFQTFQYGGILHFTFTHHRT